MDVGVNGFAAAVGKVWTAIRRWRRQGRIAGKGLGRVNAACFVSWSMLAMGGVSGGGPNEQNVRSLR